MGENRRSDLVTLAENLSADDVLLLDGPTEGVRRLLATRLVALTPFPFTEASAWPRTVADKLSDINTIADYGGITDRETVADIPFSRAQAAGRVLYPAKNGQYYISSGRTLPDGAVLLFPDLVYNTPTQLFQGAPKDLVVFGARVRVTGTPAHSGHFIQFIGDNREMQDLLLIALNVEAERFGILLNNGPFPGNGLFGKNLIISNSIIKSRAADGIAINMWQGRHENVVISGSIVQGGPAASATAGIGIGLAGVQHASITGNVVYDAAHKALHVEDQSRGIVFIGNIGAKCQGNGVFLVRAPAVSTAGAEPNDGAAVIGNYLGGIEEDHSHKTDDGCNGVFVPFSPPGQSFSINALIGNRVRHFKNGIQLGSQVQATIGNTAHDCDVALLLRSAGGGVAEGTTFARNCETMLSSREFHWAERAAMDNRPRGSVLQILADGPEAGCMAGFTDGFVLLDNETVLAHAGNGLQWFDVIEAPDMMVGRLAIAIQGEAKSVNLIAMIWFDGTALRIADLQTSSSGIAKSAPALRVEKNKLQICIEANSTINFTKTMVDFHGSYFKFRAGSSRTHLGMPTATAAELSDVTHPINTTGKYPTKEVWDTTNKKLTITGDGAAAALWYYKDGASPVSPTTPK